MPPHVLVDFVVLPPGHGRNLTDFWGWDAHEARLRCPDDVSGDIGGCSARRALKPKFYLPRPWSQRESFRENSHGRAGNRTRELMISRQRLWPLDHEAGHIYIYIYLVCSYCVWMGLAMQLPSHSLCIVVPKLWKCGLSPLVLYLVGRRSVCNRSDNFTASLKTNIKVAPQLYCKLPCQTMCNSVERVWRWNIGRMSSFHACFMLWKIPLFWIQL